MLTIGLSHYLVLSAIVFAIGLYGALAKRNAVVILMSIELMFNAVNVAFVRRPQTLAGIVSILAIALSFVISLLTLLEGINASAGLAEGERWRIDLIVPWLEVGNAHIELSTFVDPIGAVMLVVVTFV